MPQGETCGPRNVVPVEVDAGAPIMEADLEAAAGTASCLWSVTLAIGSAPAVTRSGGSARGFAAINFGKIVIEFTNQVTHFMALPWCGWMYLKGYSP